MSGIVGIINLDGAPVDRDLLERMTHFMTYRGPDAQELWADGFVGLGHALLKTTNESETEVQPLTLDGKVWLTADARIDGRAPLERELEDKLGREIRVPIDSTGSASRFPNDAELILLSYEAWAEDCINHLVGDFAFAIWDSRQQRLFCARDHFGVKPFYYSRVGRSFVFSNTLNCLRQHPGVSATLNEVAIADYLLFGYNQVLSTTTFKDIQRLPQASTLSVSIEGEQLRRYWNPPEFPNTEPRRSPDYPQQFAEIFSQAVKDRLRTNKISISMSGGLDSTSVAAVARALLSSSSAPSEMRGYVVVYDRLIPDEERQFSTLAASALGIPVTHLPADNYLLFEQKLPNELQQPEPFLVNPTSAQFNELLRSMASHSRVGLSGWDGDAFMNEPAHLTFAAAARDLRLRDLLSDLAWFISRKRLPPIGVRTILKRVVRSDSGKPVFPEWINNSFSERLKLRERWNEFTSEKPARHKRRPHAFGVLTAKHWDSLFESYDAGTHRLALEMRHPMIDVRLVKFLLSVPTIPWCVEKEILRMSMIGKLPEVIRNRPKTPLAGFPALRLVEKSSVRFIDYFKPTPSLTQFVNSSATYPVAREQNYDRLSINLRPFGLNHWLKHSLPAAPATTVSRSNLNRCEREALTAPGALQKH